MTILNKSFMPNLYKATYLVSEDHDGMRLDKYIALYLESFSREAIKKKIKEGDISIEDRPGKIRPSSVVKYKDIIHLITKETIHEEEFWNGELLNIERIPETIFEDDDLLVTSKPTFMSTHPTGRHLFNCATVYYESIHHKTVHSIHRLDRETSGILLLAKNPKAAQIMTAHFENDRVSKCYFFIALPNKNFKGEQEFESRERLGAKMGGLKRIYINSFHESSKEGKHAKTSFRILESGADCVIGLAFPQTGRQHQIRVHAMLRGLPLLGDKLYLGSFEMFQRFKDNVASAKDHDDLQIPRHALHAIALKIPYQGIEKTYISHIPNDLKEWIKDSTTININSLENKIDKEIENYFKRDSK